MKVLVTGATGFIGSHVVPELLSRGHKVRILARTSSDTSALPHDVEIFKGDLSDVDHALDGIEGLAHLVGIGEMFLKHGDRQDRKLREINAGGARTVFRAARRAGVRRAVLVSTMWTVLRPDLCDKSPYLASRLDAEKAALAASDRKLETVVICPTYVVGPRDRGPNFPGQLILACMRGAFPVALPGGMTWIAAQDAAKTICAALERGKPRERYVIGAEHRTHADLLRRVAQASHRRAPIGVMPLRAMRLAGQVGDWSLNLVGLRGSIPLRLGVDLLCADAPCDCSLSWRDLGEPTVLIDKAVEEAVAWFYENGYVDSKPRKPNHCIPRH